MEHGAGQSDLIQSLYSKTADNPKLAWLTPIFEKILTPEITNGGTQLKLFENTSAGFATTS